MPVGDEGSVDDALAAPSDFDGQSIITEIPAGSSGSAGTSSSDDPLAEGGAQEDQSDDEVGGLGSGVPEEFPKDLRSDLQLMLQGKRLTKTFTWLGHQYTIQQLDTGQLMDIGLVHRDYAGTLGDTKAYQAAMLAASVTRIDGEPMPIPPSLKKADGEIDAVFLDRFRYVRTWFPPTVDHIYEHCLQLDFRVQQIIEAMGNQSG